MPGSLWQPVATCGALWSPVAADWIPSNNLYSMLAGWRLLKLDDLTLLASWLRMLMNVDGEW